MSRDRELLHAIGRMGQANADQLRRLFFGRDQSTAFRRLRKLETLKLVERHVVHVNEPNVYTLTSTAISLLVQDGHDRGQIHRHRVGQRRDQHLELLNDVRVELVLATRGRCDLELRAFHGDLDLRRAAGARVPAYIPDGIAVLGVAGGLLVMVLEIDVATEGAAVFGEKVRITVDLWRDGEKCWGAEPGSWRPIVFVPNATRARALAHAIDQAGGAELWLLAEFDRLREVGVLGPIFATSTEVLATPRGAEIRYEGALATAPRGGSAGGAS